MKSVFFQFLLIWCFAPAAVCAQSAAERMTAIFALPADTIQVRKLTELAEMLSAEMQAIPDELFDRGLALAHDLEDFRGVASLSSERYFYYYNAGQIDKGMPYVQKAIKYAELGGDDHLLRLGYTNEVVFLMTAGDTKLAATKAAALAEFFHAADDVVGEASAYSILSSLSATLGDRELTATYDSLAISLARQSPSRFAVEEALGNAASNQNQLGNSAAALPLVEEALLIAREIGDEIGEGNALSERAETNTLLGNYDAALKDYETLKVGEGGQQSAYRIANKGILLQRVGRHDEARDLLLRAVKMVKESSNNPAELKSFFQGLQTVGLNQAQYDTVSYYGKMMAAQQDSLQAAENIKNLQDLKEKYKTKEKEDEIRWQEEQLARQRVQLYATIAGLLIATLGGGVFFFLSQRLRKRNQEVERLLQEKEILNQEVHHRVKNNLQVIGSLLQLQRRGLDTEDARGREALRESQNRVNTMGLIHQKLYQGSAATSVFMPEFLEDLGGTLQDAYQVEEQIDFFYDVAPLQLDVDEAIPIGLIVNELVTNALKYAFPPGREGTVEISLTVAKDVMRLAVIDDGVGAAAAERRPDSTSFGNNLVTLLTKKIKGELSYLEAKGYGVAIHFPAGEAVLSTS